MHGIAQNANDFGGEHRLQYLNGFLYVAEYGGQKLTLLKPIPPTVPAAPTGLTATAASSSQINLAWSDTANNETGFRIERVCRSGVPVGLALPKWKDSFWVRALERISFESARIWKTLFAYQFIVRARAERNP